MVTKVSLLFPNAINPVAVSWLPRWVEVVDSRTIEQDGSLDVVIAWGRKGPVERISHLTCPKIDVQHGVYDEVIVSPIEEYLNQSTEMWDAILLLDVLEHFSHDTGSQLLAAARGRLSQGGQFFVGTPAVWIEQTAAYGNEFERHQSLWTAEELRRRVSRCWILASRTGLGIGCCWGEERPVWTFRQSMLESSADSY